MARIGVGADVALTLSLMAVANRLHAIANGLTADGWLWHHSLSRRIDVSHTPMKPPAHSATVDDYISASPADIRHLLHDICETIRRAAPGASERISYGLPTFVLGEVIVHFGAFKGHIGLFPPVREPELQSRILPYRGENANLRFPLDQPIPHDLIADIVKARVEAARRSQL